MENINFIYKYLIISFFFFFCCKNKTNGALKIIKSDFKTERYINDSEICKNRIKSLTISCGSGCALTLDEKRIKKNKGNVFEVNFSQVMTINEQIQEQIVVKYFIKCNQDGTVEKVFNSENDNLLDKKETVVTQRLSFEKYSKSFCGCLN